MMRLLHLWKDKKNGFKRVKLLQAFSSPPLLQNFDEIAFPLKAHIWKANTRSSHCAQ